MFFKYNSNLKQFAKKNRQAGNLVEALLWNELKAKKLGCQFNRQKPIGSYIVDFVCKELMLIIEIDGLSHDGKVEYDEDRDANLSQLGYYVMHFANDDILKNLVGVVDTIYSWVSTRKG